MYRAPRLALLLFLALLLTAGLAPGVLPALAACGGGPCSCGDTVDSDTTLHGTIDPVCSTDPGNTCQGVGLIVNPGIILDLGGCTLRGTGEFFDGVQASAGAQVLNGRVIGFGAGGVVLTGNGGRVSTLRVSGNGFGITVLGDDNVVSRVQALDNAVRGVEVEGDGNTVETTNAWRNKSLGVAVFGNNNTVRNINARDNGSGGLVSEGDNTVIANNTLLRNGGGCAVIVRNGTNATVTQNQVRHNGLGVCPSGSGHSVRLNVVSGSDFNGFLVSATGSVFERNSSKGNGEFGIVDETGGGGTSGTANTYIGNICTGNGSGASSPGGLCK